MRILQLPPAVANQIAAGEVIERPASVVKELLENSFDAGADAITIEIGYGGLNQIKISDNGAGIMAEDLPLAVAAHATSKITKLDDLYAIESMGFRGEALASIASVAKVTISSKTASQEHAMMLQIKGVEAKISPCARSIGTTIDVIDLFFNAPVRKRFLKSEQLEFQAIETVTKRFALSAPHIALTLKHNNKLVLSLPPAVSEQAKRARMIKLFGNAFVKDAVFLDVERGGMRLYGWTSGPGFQRSQNDRQWIYINHRMVKDKLINHAVKQAYNGLLHPGRFPACLLYFTLDTAEVDVNVHPTKHEVRFQQPRLVHDFFTSQLTEALKTVGLSSNEQDYSLFSSVSSEEPAVEVCEPSLPLNLLEGNGHAKDEPIYLKNIWNSTAPGESVIQQSYGSPIKLREESRIHQSKSGNSVQFPEKETPWVILNNQYVLIFIQQLPYLVDVFALQQYGLQQHLSQLDLPLESRPLLVPVSYTIPPKLIHQTVVLQQGLAPLGIQIEFQTEGKALIKSVPIKIPYLDIRLLLDTVAELQVLTVDKLLEVISKAQVFDPRFLSAEERMELNQLLFLSQTQEIKQHTFYKKLTVDDCRMLLNV